MLWFFESFFPAVWIAFLLYWQIKAADEMNQAALGAFAGEDVRAAFAALEGDFLVVPADLAFLAFGAVAAQAILGEDGLDVLDEIHFDGGGGVIFVDP